MNTNSAITLIKDYITQSFVSAEIQKEYNEPSGFWGVWFTFMGATVQIDSDRGGLECNLTINNSKFPLWQFDRGVVDATNSNEDNIRRILNTLKKFFV